MIIDGELEGIQAISLVEAPAIEENWVALSEQVQFKAQDQEKRIVMGPALIPDKPIYRRKGEEEFHIFFSKKPSGRLWSFTSKTDGKTPRPWSTR